MAAFLLSYKDFGDAASRYFILLFRVAVQFLVVSDAVGPTSELGLHRPFLAAAFFFLFGFRGEGPNAFVFR